ncbi:MAG: tetratricopeptide repeat protein [Pirellulaceae bacterium]
MLQRLMVLVFWCGLGLTPGLYAQNEGQEDLDKATEFQLKQDKTPADLEQVIKLTESALQKGLDDTNAAFARELLVSSLWQRATFLTKSIFETQSPSPRWRQIRQAALADLEKLIKTDPKFADAYTLGAKLQLLPGGSADKAREWLDEAVKLFGSDKRKLSDAMVLRAQLQQDPDKQLSDLTEAIDTDPTNVGAWQARAAHFISRGDLDKAIPDFEKLLERDPSNLAIRQALVEAFANLDKYDLALEHASKVIEMQPKSADAHTLRARVYERKDDYKSALADLDEALKLEPENLLALYTRARLRLMEDDYKAAREDLEKFMKSRGNSVQGVLLRSMISAAEGNFRDAIADIQLLLRNDPGNTQFRLQLGTLYVGDQRPRKAIEVFTSLLEEDKSNASALRARGDALLSIGKHKEAIADFEAGLKLEPDNDGMLNNLAWVLATSPFDEVRDAKRSIELGK